VAVEFLGADAFAHHVKQFTVVFRRSHLTVPSSVDVGDVEHGDGPFDVVHNLKHFLKAAPEFLATRGFNTNFRGRAVFDPREHREFVLIIVPNFMDAVHDSREHVGDLLVGCLATAEVAVVAGVERDVAGVDGSSSLQGGFDFGE